MGKIKLSNGIYCSVDDCNINVGGKYKWQFSGNYAKNVSKKKIWGNKKFGVYMHNVLVWCPKGYQIDHINGDKLDNRIKNLRITTCKQNAQNIGIRSNNTSGYKGVSLTKEKNRWRAYIKVSGKQKNLGFFVKKEDAAIAYNKAAETYFGKYARLNKID